MARILVVDDDGGSRFVLRKVLGVKYECQVVDNRADGLRIVEDERPSLIVLDLHFPVGMDGWGFMERVRELYGAEVPLIVVSAYITGPSVASRARDAGARAVIAKPFEGKALLGQVAEFLS